MKRKYPFTFTLFTASCKKESGKLSATSMRMAKQILKVRYPKCTKIELKSRSSFSDNNGYFPSMNMIS